MWIRIIDEYRGGCYLCGVEPTELYFDGTAKGLCATCFGEYKPEAFIPRNSTEKLRNLMIDNPGLPVVHWTYVNENYDENVIELRKDFTVNIDDYLIYKGRAYTISESEELYEYCFGDENYELMHGEWDLSKEEILEIEEEIEERFKDKWIKAIIISV